MYDRISIEFDVAGSISDHMPGGLRGQSSVRTTLALPADLLRAIDRAVQEGQVGSRSEFVVAAVRHELAARERAAIDAAFAAMADDLVYQAEAKAIAAEFELADWEALRQVAPEP